MPEFYHDHIFLNGRTERLPYTSNQKGRSKITPRTIEHLQEHGNKLKEQIVQAVEEFNQGNDNEYVYVVVRSAENLLLDIEKFDKSECQLCSYRTINEAETKAIEAVVRLNKSAVSKFLKKIDEFINGVTKKGLPKNQPLIANIEEIRNATLQSFWQEIATPFPNADELLWWEVWMNSSAENIDPLENFRQDLQKAGIEIHEKILSFPENTIYLIRGTATQLSNTLLYTDQLAEIRKPREAADFFTYLDRAEQNDWIAEAVNRIRNNSQNSSIALCLLDTGVTLNNPLLVACVQPRNLEALKPHWTVADTGSHGTLLAGLALFGDLTDVFDSNTDIEINHTLESIKLIEAAEPHLPTVYGAVTKEAIARSEILNQGFKRQICMAVTSEEFIHLGRPSSWSAAIDQSIFGEVNARNNNVIFFVSAGNLALEEIISYPLSNDDYSIHDPAQSFNSITVGAFTEKNQLNLVNYPGAQLLSHRGAMCGSSSTSVPWDREWCRKPDIVMEGGNYAVQNNNLISPDSLKLLTTNPGGIGRSWLTTCGDTSGATALAAKLSAELYHHYPTYWPETVRALIIHSAEWTQSQLGNLSISDLTLQQKEKLISTVGYGTPSLQKAKFSANNSLSIIAEREIKPYKLDGNSVKTDEFHLFDLPWPTDVLQQLENTQVSFKITLSYFIEPNPGSKTYEKSASYRSHGLRFKMIDSNESLDAFKARVSKSMRDENEYVAEGGERWILGTQIRDKGCIHKDIWTGSAIDLSSRNKIAIYPVSGWWKTRKKQNRFGNSVRYSVVMTIESPAENIDILTPVLNELAIEI